MTFRKRLARRAEIAAWFCIAWRLRGIALIFSAVSDWLHRGSSPAPAAEYVHGFRAALEGFPSDANPHRVTSPKWQHWRDGWKVGAKMRLNSYY